MFEETFPPSAEDMEVEVKTLLKKQGLDGAVELTYRGRGALYDGTDKTRGHTYVGTVTISGRTRWLKVFHDNGRIEIVEGP